MHSVADIVADMTHLKAAVPLHAVHAGVGLVLVCQPRGGSLCMGHSGDEKLLSAVQQHAMRSPVMASVSTRHHKVPMVWWQKAHHAVRWR